MSVREFFDALPSVDQDLLLAVLADGMTEASVRRLSNIERQLDKTVAEIDRINRFREVMSAKVEHLAHVVRALGEQSQRTPQPVFDLLREALGFRMRQMREEIETVRPADELARKAQLIRERDGLLAHSNVCRTLLDLVQHG